MQRTPSMRWRSAATAAACLLALCGCVHRGLRDDTLRMAATLSELHYRMVMNNFAMLEAQADALPSHVTFEDGTLQVTDRHRGLLDLAGLRDDFDPTLGLRRRHSVTGQWRIRPVSDPDELRELQAIYRVTLGHDIEDEILEQLGDAAEVSTGWVETGPRREVPDEAVYVGRHRDMYSWVTPARVEQLTRFTLAVLTIVRVDEDDRAFGAGGLVPIPD